MGSNMACKHRIHVAVAFLVVCFFIFFSAKCYVGLGENMMMSSSSQKQTDAEESSKMPVIDAVRSLFSPRITSRLWIDKVKTFFQQGRAYFSYPNLDFRGGSGGDEGGATDKVKEAGVKSLDKSKATVEDSAKSAAKFAEEAADKTVKKLKKTLSGKGNHQVEL